MHELSLMESLVATVEENLAEGRVVAVRLEIGRLAVVVPDSLRFCFDLCVRGTRLEGATLEIREIDGRGTCGACGVERAVDLRFVPCGCGSFDVRLIAGNELRIRELEVI